MTKIRFDENRTYGIEIEVMNGQGYSQEQIASKIREYGVNSFVEGYNHNTKQYWKVITDSSCGYEVVSPVLRGRDAFNQIEKVCAALNELGCKVNHKCGLHVHHNASDLSVKAFKNLYTMYAKYEEGIDQVIAASRRGNNNSYCNSVRKGLTLEQSIEKIQQCKNLEQLQTLYGSRYQKLNIQSYVRHGTIEFRQHQGTMNATKIINWIMLTQFMVTKSATSTVKANLDGKNDLYWFLSMLGARVSATWTEDTKAVAQYYKARAKALAA